jgi:Cyclin, N-terminal domain/Cyclin, C-terminal domain
MCYAKTFASYLLFTVVDHFDLRREIVNIAMSHLDRYLSACPEPVEKSTFQLLSMTCLYLAIKLNETRIIVIPGSKSSMDTLLQLSRGVFTLEEVERMEYDILQRLQWHVHPPTPQLFVRTFLFLISSQNNQESTIMEQEIHGLANFMVELSVMDYFLAKYKSSEIAMAGILNALDEIDGGLQADAQATTNLQDQWILPLVTQDFNMDMSNVEVCRRRLQLIYSENKDAFYEDVEESSSSQDQDPGARTTSPVCVMRAP